MKRHGLLGCVAACGWALVLAGAATAQDGPLLFEAGESAEPSNSTINNRPASPPHSSPATRHTAPEARVIETPDAVEGDVWPPEPSRVQTNRRGVGRAAPEVSNPGQDGSRPLVREGRPAAQPERNGTQRPTNSRTQEQERMYREWLNSRQNQRRSPTQQQRTGQSDQQDVEPGRRDTRYEQRVGPQGATLGGQNLGRSPGRNPTWPSRPSIQPGRPGFQGPVGGLNSNGAQSVQRGVQPPQRKPQPWQGGMRQVPGAPSAQQPTLQRQQSAAQPPQRGMQPPPSRWQNPPAVPRRTPTPTPDSARDPRADRLETSQDHRDLWSDASNQQTPRAQRHQPSKQVYPQRAAQPSAPRNGVTFGGGVRR